MTSTIFRHVLQVVLCIPEVNDEYWYSRIFGVSDGFTWQEGKGGWLGDVERNVTVTVWFSAKDEPLLCRGCLLDLLEDYQVQEKQVSIAVTLDGVPELLFDNNDIRLWTRKVENVTTNI